jgi:hypothetical protein
VGFQFTVNAGGMHLTRCAGYGERAVDRLDFVEPGGTRHGQVVFDEGGKIVKAPAKSEIVGRDTRVRIERWFLSESMSMRACSRRSFDQSFPGNP